MNVLFRESPRPALLRAVMLVAPGAGAAGRPARGPGRTAGSWRSSSRSRSASPRCRSRRWARRAWDWWSSGGRWPLPTAYLSVRSWPRSCCWPPTSPRCCSPTARPRCRSAPAAGPLAAARRGVAVAAPLVWLVAVVVDDQPEPPGIWIAGLACAVVVCVVAATAVTMREERGGDWARPEEYVELVLSVVEEIPRGRVTSYGAIAGGVGGGPRQVGAVMSRHGGPVPWWRVVRADGSLPPSHEDEARPHYLDEGTPLRPSGAVDMTAAFWEPSRPHPWHRSRSDRSPQIGPKSVHKAVHKSGCLVENSHGPVDEAVEPEECLPNLLRGGSPGNRTSPTPPLRWRCRRARTTHTCSGPSPFPSHSAARLTPATPIRPTSQ